MGLRSLLSIPSIYSGFQSLTSGNARQVYSEQHIKAVSGSRILDIGCGTADILEFLPASTEYTGFDISEDYIASAKSRFGRRGNFFCSPVTASLAEQLTGFDIVLANGVLHHLDDKSALDLLRIARTALSDDGRFISLDGCFVSGQSPIARFLLSRDRGEFVRNETQYRNLAGQVFKDISVTIRHDLMRIPYTHIIMECIRTRS